MTQSELYLLMDARAFHDPDEAGIIDTGTAEAMCQAANDDEFGECAVVNERLEVMWSWYHNGKIWRVTK